MHAITRICQQHSVFFVGHRGRHTGRYGRSPFGRLIARPCAYQDKTLIISPSIHREEDNTSAQANPIAKHARKQGKPQRTRANNMQQTNNFKYPSEQGWTVNEYIKAVKMGQCRRCGRSPHQSRYVRVVIPALRGHLALALMA